MKNRIRPIFKNSSETNEDNPTFAGPIDKAEKSNTYLTTCSVFRKISEKGPPCTFIKTLIESNFVNHKLFISNFFD